MINIYGLLISTGIFLGFFTAERLAKRFKLSVDVWQLLPWTVGLGLVGARAYHVVDYWQFYSQNLSLIPQVWKGGLGIFGAIVGGFLGVVVYNLLKFKRFLKILVQLDLGVVGLSLGQAIGRWGNFFNQEIYGWPTSLPWGVKISGKPGRYHPLFLYESLAMFLGFLILKKNFVKRYKNHKKPGYVFVFYLLIYGLTRFVLEPLRSRSWVYLGVRVGQAVGLLMMFLGIFTLVCFKIASNGEKR